MSKSQSYTLEEIKEAGLDDFRVFLHQVWVHLGLTPNGSRKPKATAIQNDIAKYLQYGNLTYAKGSTEREQSRRRQIVMGYRGVGKSFITVAFVLWTLLLNPQAKIMVISATEGLANDFSKFCQQLIESMPMLAHLKANNDQRASVYAYDVGPAKPDKSPSLKAVGISGQITGSRADLIIADDIEIPKNSYSQVMREKLAISVREFDAILKPGGKIVYLGTPQIEASLYIELQKRGYFARIWPSEVPKDVSVYHGKLAPFILKLIQDGAKAGTPVDPGRFTREDLDERLLSYGRGGYNLQFMLDTKISEEERHPLKLRDLIIMSLDEAMAHLKIVWGGEPNVRLTDLEACGMDGDYYVRPTYLSDEMAKYTGCVLAIDPSGKGKDETGYAVVKNLYGLLFLVDVGGFRDGFGPATLDALATKCVRWGVTQVVIEKNFGDGMFGSLLQPVIQQKIAEAKALAKEQGLDARNMGPPIEEVWHTGQKELRIIDTLAPLVQSHRLIVDRRVIEKDVTLFGEIESERYSFVFQFTRITRDKGSLGNEDRLEAVEVACKWFVDRMSHDATKQVAKVQEEGRLKAALDFINVARSRPGRAFIFGMSKQKTNTQFGRRGRGA